MYDGLLLHSPILPQNLHNGWLSWQSEMKRPILEKCVKFFALNTATHQNWVRKIHFPSSPKSSKVNDG
uniref:Uncharacterized protein n=1 Tax=Romanomermis culicivorax TaxID=13658 RepID=A0A915KX15_ROMCU